MRDTRTPPLLLLAFLGLFAVGTLACLSRLVAQVQPVPADDYLPVMFGWHNQMSDSLAVVEAWAVYGHDSLEAFQRLMASMAALGYVRDEMAKVQPPNGYTKLHHDWITAANKCASIEPAFTTGVDKADERAMMAAIDAVADCRDRLTAVADEANRMK